MRIRNSSAADGLHPTVEGQTRIAEAFRDEIVRRYGSDMSTTSFRFSTMRRAAMMSDRWRSRLKDVVAPALLVVLPLCLFGPYTIFSGNEAEFSAPFWVLVRPLLLAGAGIALVLIAVGLVLPSRLFRAYVVLLFSVGLVIWIQGNLLVADYGAFTGVPIDWSIESWRNPYEIALWIAVPVLACHCSEIRHSYRAVRQRCARRAAGGCAHHLSCSAQIPRQPRDGRGRPSRCSSCPGRAT